jgi:hypothetical protein
MMGGMMMMPDMNMEQLKQQMSQMNMDAMGHQMPPGHAQRGARQGQPPNVS